MGGRRLIYTRPAYSFLSSSTPFPPSSSSLLLSFSLRSCCSNSWDIPIFQIWTNVTWTNFVWTNVAMPVGISKLDLSAQKPRGRYLSRPRQPFSGPLEYLGFDFYWKKVNFNCVWKCLFIKMLDKVSRSRETEVRIVSRNLVHNFGSILGSSFGSIFGSTLGLILGFRY